MILGGSVMWNCWVIMVFRSVLIVSMMLERLSSCVSVVGMDVVIWRKVELEVQVFFVVDVVFVVFGSLVVRYIVGRFVMWK